MSVIAYQVLGGDGKDYSADLYGDMRQVGRVWSKNWMTPFCRSFGAEWMGTERCYAQDVLFCEEWTWYPPRGGSWKLWIDFPREDNWKDEVVRMPYPTRRYVRCLT